MFQHDPLTEPQSGFCGSDPEHKQAQKRQGWMEFWEGWGRINCCRNLSCNPTWTSWVTVLAKPKIHYIWFKNTPRNCVFFYRRCRYGLIEYWHLKCLRRCVSEFSVLPLFSTTLHVSQGGKPWYLLSPMSDTISVTLSGNRFTSFGTVQTIGCCSESW